MARRILNRHELRRRAAHTARPEAVASDATQAVWSRGKRAKKVTTPRKPRAKRAPPRMRARWGLFNGTMKQVAIFDYNQRDAADAKLADLVAKSNGIHFLQVVKELMPESVVE